MKSEKLLEMEEYIRFRQTISLKELQEHFNISINNNNFTKPSAVCTPQGVAVTARAKA